MSDYLIREALIEILARLPAETLLRFRCVSKTWLSLISSPDFTSVHVQAAAAKPPLLLLHSFSLTGLRPIFQEFFSLRADDADFTSLLDIECPFNPRSENFFRVVGSCNGLVCLSDEMFGHTCTVILWNPAIRRYLTLPMPNICYEDYRPFMFSLGFSFEPKTNDHKVIRIVYLEGSERGKACPLPPEVEVYTLNTGVWKTRKNSKIAYHMVDVFWSSAFANGRVHWTAYSGGKSTSYYNVVLVFDMSTEEFREVKLPGHLVGASPLDLVVAGYKDTISIFQYDGRRPDCCNDFTVWVMKEYGVEESWSKLFTVSLDGGAVLGFRKSGEVVVENWVGKLVSCQPGKINELGIRGAKGSFLFGYLCREPDLT